jgi:hypothetical protein
VSVEDRLRSLQCVYETAATGRVAAEEGNVCARRPPAIRAARLSYRYQVVLPAARLLVGRAVALLATHHTRSPFSVRLLSSIAAGTLADDGATQRDLPGGAVRYTATSSRATGNSAAAPSPRPRTPQAADKLYRSRRGLARRTKSPRVEHAPPPPPSRVDRRTLAMP